MPPESSIPGNLDLHKSSNKELELLKISLTAIITDEIYRNLLFAGFLIQTSLVHYLLPFGVGSVLSFLCVCWVYAFYSFEYDYINFCCLTD